MAAQLTDPAAGLDSTVGRRCTRTPRLARRGVPASGPGGTPAAAGRVPGSAGRREDRDDRPSRPLLGPGVERSLAGAA